MPTSMLVKRVEILENTMNGPGGVLEQLAGLRADVTSFRGEFLQFRDETRVEFSAIRAEFRTELRQGLDDVRTELRTELRAEIGGLRAQMLMLHEEVLSRLKLIQEGLSGRP